MKNIIEKLIAGLRDWMDAADAEFAKKDKCVQQIYLDIINDWR